MIKYDPITKMLIENNTNSKKTKDSIITTDAFYDKEFKIYIDVFELQCKEYLQDAKKAAKDNDKQGLSKAANSLGNVYNNNLKAMINDFNKISNNFSNYKKQLESLYKKNSDAIIKLAFK